MLIRCLAVRNYRALREMELGLGDLTYLVGRNGAGKSSILSALGVFFRQVPVTVHDFSLGITDRPIEIEVTFTGLSRDAGEEFEKYVRNGELAVVKRISLADGKISERYHGMIERFPPFDEIRAETGRLRIDLYRASRERWDLPTATSAEGVNAALREWEDAHPDELELGEDDGSFFGFTNVGTGKIGKYIDFVVVPAVRDAAVDAIEGRDSTLRRLVDAVVRRTLNLDDALASFRRKMTTGYQDILERPELSLHPLESRMTTSIGRFAPGAAVRLRWNDPGAIEIPSPAAFARLEDDGLEGDITSKGHGLQRAYVMAALQALAEAEAERMEREENFERGLLLAVEEPELFQHPAQARHIAQTFASLTAAGTQVQVLSCTHSPLFVDIRSFESVRVVRKNPDGYTRVSQATLDDSANVLGAAHETGRRFTADGLRPGLRGLLNPYISEAFFADFVVLVEGEEDKAMLESSLAGHPESGRLRRLAFVITPVSGKKNLDKMVAILRQLEVPFYLTFDRDGEQGEAEASVTRTNVALQRLMAAPEPVPMPDTLAGPTFAVFSPSLTSCVKSEIGQDEWIAYRETACEESGLEVRRNVEKNAEIVRRMLELARDSNRSSPSLGACADAIVRAVIAAYPMEAEAIPE